VPLDSRDVAGILLVLGREPNQSPVKTAKDGFRMSSLIFHTTEDEIILAMDTLAVGDLSGTPVLFTTKFYPVPHLGGVICGTGVGKLVLDWFARVNSGMVVRDLVNLDEHTPAALRELSSSEDYRVPDVSQSTTVYHLGFPVDGGPACVFAYRSTSNFSSERLRIGGTAIKPMGDIPQPLTLPNDFGKMMMSQRTYQNQKPFDERIQNGGDIVVCQMTRTMTSIYRMGKFHDRDAMAQIMFENVSEPNSET